jgi:hypothetical protein
MKKLFVTVIGVLTISLMIVNCKKSDIVSNNTLKNSITYNNTQYDLNSGFLEYYGNIGGTGLNIDLTLISSGLIPVLTNGLIDSLKGTGNGINFEIFTTTATALDVRDYSFDAGMSGTAGTFDYANTILNFNTLTKQGIDLDINGGTVTIKSNGTQYELTFSCTGVNGKSVTGYYKGSLTYYDRSVGTKSARINKLRKW